jgi:hypothetical protein
MTRILEINYWKVTPGAEEGTEELVWKFAKFAHKNLEAVFKFGIVDSGKYVDHAAFFFLWESDVGYKKWKVECNLNKEFQDWLSIVQDGGQKNKRVDCDIIHMVDH